MTTTDTTAAGDAIDPATITHNDIVLLTSWMAGAGYTAQNIAYAVEKPWKYLDELAQARADLADSMTETAAILRSPRTMNAIATGLEQLRTGM